MHNEELYNLYSSPSLIKMIQSRRMRLEGYVARTVEKINACRFPLRKLDRKKTIKRTSHRWGIILKRILTNGME
jgi:hypothetical protein